MRLFFLSFLTLSFLLLLTTSFTIVEKENHADLTNHHNKISEFVSLILNSKNEDIDERKSYSTEAGKHLSKAQAIHEKIKEEMPEKHKTMAKPHHEAINRHLSQVKKHHNSLQAELAKENPDEGKVRQYALSMNTSVINSEAENQKLLTKIVE